jgi:two-component system chemotaxis response regulator CheY
MRFLVIDDSVTMRRIIANILVRLGYPEVLHASNGREALDRLAAEPVDVVITDWYMPELSGLDFVKQLRNSPATRHIPIVIVTANAASDDIHNALELGVKSYILKPFTVETMKDKIGALISQIEPGAAESGGDSAATPVDEPIAATDVAGSAAAAESVLEVQAEPAAAV